MHINKFSLGKWENGKMKIKNQFFRNVNDFFEIIFGHDWPADCWHFEKEINYYRLQEIANFPIRTKKVSLRRRDQREFSNEIALETF